MKNSILKLLVLATLVFAYNCKDAAKEAETNNAKEAAKANKNAVTYNADVNASVIEWTGFKPTGSHNGTIALASGVFMVEDDKIASGNFTIDMKSIEVVDIPVEDEGNANLKGHLMHADFFDVENYPTAEFEVTGLATSNDKTWLEGNLTMKDSTNNVKIPVTTTIKDGVLELNSEPFSIDRTKWNVQYGSKSIFDNLGDKFINDDIELKVKVIAKKE